MKKITVTFRCDCGYIETADVLHIPALGELINDYIQFGKIYMLAKQHALEIHSKKLDFSLFTFVKAQRNQRKQKREEIQKFKELVKNQQEMSPELIKFLKEMQQAAVQKRRYDEWQELRKSS